MNNLSCIPFYTKKEHQDFRLWYSYGEKYPYYVPSDFLIPFSFAVPYHAGQPDNIEVEFYRACCSEEQYLGIQGAYNEDFSIDFAKYTTDFSATMNRNGLVVKNDDTRKISVLTYFAREEKPLDLEEGMYYMKITLVYGQTNETYYSDVFFVKDASKLDKYVCIKWRNEENLEYDGGFIPYGESEGGEPFTNRLYLDTTIAMPEYKFTEDGEERNGRFFPIKQISEKVYKMSFIAPEYLCDVMRLIRMADYIELYDGLGRTLVVEQFEMDVKWSQGGHYAEVTCSIQTDSVIKKIGKAYSY